MLKHDSITAASRLFVRHETHFEASVEVHPDQADQIRMSFPDALSDFKVVDVSKGGLGLRSSVYLPKNLRLNLSVRGTNKKGEALPRALAIRVIVRRCSLLDHKPSYLVGLQFVDAAGRDEQQLVKTAAFIQESEKSPVAAGGAARGA